MTYRSRISLINFSIWLVLFILFCLIFFSNVEGNYRITTAIIFAAANIINVILLMIQHGKETSDERTKSIESLSSTITMIAMMVVVYLGSISLYVLYEEIQTVPVYWLWFIAYAAVFLIFIIYNLSYVIVSLKGNRYES